MRINKKAQASNYFAVIIFLFIFGFFCIFSYMVWLRFVESLTATGFVTSTIQTTIDDFSKGLRAFDYIIVILMVVLIIGIGLTSYKLATSTAFFIITLFMAAFWGFVSYFFNYVFIQLVSQDVFAVALGVFPRTLLLCTNLHWVMLLEIIVGSLTLYGKKEQGQYLA